MRSFFDLIENINPSLLERFTIIFKNESEDDLNKILNKNKSIRYSENDRFYKIVGSNENIPLPYNYDVIFNIDDIEECFEVSVTIKAVFALGFKEMNEIPADWNVSAQICFNEYIPKELDTLHGRKFCMTSMSFWKSLQKIKSQSLGYE